MTERLYLYEAGGFDPHYNLAVEQRLLETLQPGECILYLWQNQRTVVIGRNQNPWKECRVTLLEEEGGTLARRLSGGGAVFHDLGNLNFTFLLPTEDYDPEKQTRVILTACRSLGIPAELSGRNDLTAEGRKFSGSAFYHNRGRSYHHGTLLVDVDMERMGRYLAPSPAKLAAKGVDSVRARVVNLSALQPDITVPALKEAMTAAFGRVYGPAAEPVPPERLDGDAIEVLLRRNRSGEWRCGPRLPFSFSCQGRWPWGELRLELAAENGVVRHCAVWTDAMEWELAPRLETAVTGCRFVLPELEAAIAGAAVPHGTDICALLRAQSI